MLESGLIEAVNISREKARKSYERRLFLFTGRSSDLGSVALELAKTFDEDTVVCVSNYSKFRSRFEDVCPSEKKTIIACWKTDRILGQTFDVSFIDLRDWPDVIALSRTIGTVRGGGLVFILLPYDYETRVYYEEIVPPYFDSPPRKIMMRRIVKKSMNRRGIYVYDVTEKKFMWRPEEEDRAYEKKPVIIPRNNQIPREIYELAVSNDQVKVLRAFELWRNYIVLLANRGRGKSASIGLGLTGYASLFIKKHKRPFFVCLTSRSTLNVEEVFRFARKAHEALGLSYDYSPREHMLKSDILRLEFEFPHRAIKLANIADALVVDEVAAIPFTFLRKTIKAYRKAVFSGTVHGYEGTGRIFAVRFLRMLDAKKDGYMKVELEEPVRYAENDPVEEWLFDTLLLDAEPAPVSTEILDRMDKARLVEVDPKRYFLGDKKDEEFLRTLIGILTTAHYRNNPKDLLLLSDAPHHRMFALVIDSIPLVALQIAMEGEIPSEKIQEMLEEAPSGHLIPDNIVRYTGLMEFPTLKGFRIVRIATHPDLQRRGLGSLALKKLAELAKKERAEWVGASFGANPQLLNFWIKNGFFVANMSPMVNPKTGEYSAIVLMPLSKRAERMIVEASRQLKVRLLRELRNSYWELETETAHMILKSGEPIRIIPQLNTGDIFRLGLYLSLGGKIEACIDVIAEIVNLYFARMYDFLDPEEEQLLVKKICQRRLIEKEDLARLRRIVRKLWEHIVMVKFERERKRPRRRQS